MRWKILDRQPELRPYAGEITARMNRLSAKETELLKSGQSLADFANGHLYYGLHRTKSGWVYREWAPAADSLHLIGDFNGWNRTSHPLRSIGHGNWEIEIDGADTITHLSRYKVCVTSGGQCRDRMPLYTFCTHQDEKTKDYSAVVWEPESCFSWEDSGFQPQKNVPPLIYEAHVGMASEDRRVATYREFADNILPRIQTDGYNTVQLMAVMEHPYYGSFGYHVSNFFAPSSRFGTPDDLRYLINCAHKRGINVLLDLVHSHSVSNILEGINEFDGTVYQFFHDGAKGNHPAWGSKVFDYSKSGVLHFLLSNLKYWLDEFHFDGFRFDGVTSMLYHHHGLGVDFNMGSYFTMATDVDAITYLQLASQLAHSVKPGCILIAEDMSCMPGMCLPVSEGGIGFDYRLSMGLPDFFTKTIEKVTDGHWDMGRMMWELTTRRGGEKNIAYLESHDQAIVGSQTMISMMMGATIYTGMRICDDNYITNRAVALHKMMRLIICASGDGYLNFMGNEFGHPEWIDFPRAGNGESYDYCRRQWSLEANPELRYHQLGQFDKAMIRLIREGDILSCGPLQILRIHEQDQYVVFSRGDLLFAFNFHPEKPQTSLFIPRSTGDRCRAVLSTDESAYGGQDRISMDYVYDSSNGFPIYLPPRTAVVLKKESGT